MKITREQVEHVAQLARLDLSPDKIELYANQMNDILGYMDKLAEVDTTDLPPTNHATATVNVFRKDEAKPSLETDEVLRNAPASDGRYIVVPRII